MLTEESRSHRERTGGEAMAEASAGHLMLGSQRGFVSANRFISRDFSLTTF